MSAKIVRSGVVFALFLSGLSGCEAEKRSNELAGKLDSIQKTVDELKQEVDTLKRNAEWDKVMKGFDGVAYLTPGSDGYSIVKTDLASLTVNLENIEAYANGSRVTLRFGNPSSAVINDLKGTIEWGRVSDKGGPDNEHQKSREVTFDRSIRAGAWTDVPVILEGIPPNQLGFVRLRDLSHKGISLQR